MSTLSTKRKRRALHLLAKGEDAPPSIVSHGNLSGSLGSPAEARSGSPVPTSRAKRPEEDRAVVVRPGKAPVNLTEEKSVP